MPLSIWCDVKRFAGVLLAGMVSAAAAQDPYAAPRRKMAEDITAMVRDTSA